MRLVYRCLVRNGIGRFALIDPMHDGAALLEGARMIHEEGGEVLAGLTYTISEVHDDAFYARLAGQLAASPHVARLYVKDPTGLLTPERARTVTPAVPPQLQGKALELHSHCTIGLSALTYLVAADLGVEVLHVALGALSNGTSLPNAERVVANLRERGHTVDVDDRLIGLGASYFTRLAEAENLPVGTPQEYDAAYLRHQLPGGAITTTIRQLEELKLEDRLPAVIEETVRVRAELGYPIMVTPFPQIVCTQALFNVIGAERYANVPDQVIRYVIGRFGHPTAPVEANVKDRILDRPRARELMAEPPAPGLDELRRRIGTRYSDEEFLLRAVMPAGEVDAMLAAGPAVTTYNPDTRPLLTLLRDVVARPSPADELVIEKPGLRVALRRRRSA
jgi:oxaloacetate decarboxylase alpha subunit